MARIAKCFSFPLYSNPEGEEGEEKARKANIFAFPVCIKSEEEEEDEISWKARIFFAFPRCIKSCLLLRRRWKFRVSAKEQEEATTSPEFQRQWREWEGRNVWLLFRNKVCHNLGVMVGGGKLLFFYMSFWYFSEGSMAENSTSSVLVCVSAPFLARSVPIKFRAKRKKKTLNPKFKALRPSQTFYVKKLQREEG